MTIVVYVLYFFHCLENVVLNADYRLNYRVIDALPNNVHVDAQLLEVYLES